MKPSRGDLTRFFRRVSGVAPVTGCWLWSGAKSSQDRPIFFWRGLTTSASRVAYQWFAGEIQSGLEADHLCNDGGCVNPAHLEPVTRTENLSRAVQRRSTCRRGHDRSYRYRNGDSWSCRLCVQMSRVAKKTRLVAASPKAVLDLPAEDGPVYLTTDTLAAYLGYTSKFRINNALKFIARKGVAKHYRSARCVLVKRADVDRVLGGAA